MLFMVMGLSVLLLILISLVFAVLSFNPICGAVVVSLSITSGYLDLVQRLEFGVDHLQKNAVYQIE